MDDVLTLDGAHGEGGGQILRTALTLSTITSRAFRLINLRAGRRNPGLLPQHLSAVRAAAAISSAVVSGNRLGSTELEFAPQHPPKAAGRQKPRQSVRSHMLVRHEFFATPTKQSLLDRRLCRSR